MVRYMGLDAHASSCALAVAGESGQGTLRARNRLIRRDAPEVEYLVKRVWESPGPAGQPPGSASLADAG